MQLHDCCLALQSCIREIQDCYPEYQSYGEAYPGFISKFDDQLLSLLYTKSGRVVNPAWQDKTAGVINLSLRERFMQALEGRACRRNYQRSLALLEKIFDDALPRYGARAVARLVAREPRVRFCGHQFVPVMEQAGMVFQDADRFGQIIKAAQQIEASPAPSPVIDV